MDTLAVVLEAPERLSLSRVGLLPAGDDDILVDVEWSGISSGTERLLWTGRMPSFPGMGYPLVPGYESVGRVRTCGRAVAQHPSSLRVGDRVFVPGSKGFDGVRGLFGGAAAQLVVPAARVVPLPDSLEERGVLVALAATAYHALAAPGARLPELIVGHGVLGRLLARLTTALGGAAPVVWEREPVRRGSVDGGVSDGYRVVSPDDDTRRDYASVVDVSGDSQILDTLMGRLAPGGEIVLAGFYSAPLSFAFAPAFMREARMRVAAEWRPNDLSATLELLRTGALSLDGLITHREAATDAPRAYEQAFTDQRCLKMILDWRHCR
jgi:bacteriochlorophyllide a dehydrogenase